MTRKILKIREVEERTGKKKSSIYADIKAGLFPSPISLGGRSRGWVSTEIDAWVDQRIALTRQSTSPARPPVAVKQSGDTAMRGEEGAVC